VIISSINRFNIEGVTTAQYNVLDILDKQGSKTTKELAEIRGISQARMSKLGARIEKYPNLLYIHKGKKEKFQ